MKVHRPIPAYIGASRIAYIYRKMLALERFFYAYNHGMKDLTVNAHSNVVYRQPAPS